MFMLPLYYQLCLPHCVWTPQPQLHASQWRRESVDSQWTQTIVGVHAVTEKTVKGLRTNAN